MRTSLFIFVFFAMVVTGCGSNDDVSVMEPSATPQAPAQLTSIQWLDSTRDFGRINEGQKLALSFRFKNSGNKPLIIEDVRPTCGCTVADFPKQPIAPGEEGEITGEFDSNGREGLQRKHITVRSNAEPAEQDISFEVNVIGKPRDQQQNPSF